MRKLILSVLLFIPLALSAQTYPIIRPGGGKALFELREADNPIEVPVERQVTQMYYSDGLFIYTTDSNTPWECKWTIIDLEGNKLVSDVAPFWNAKSGDTPKFYNRRAITNNGYIITADYKVVAKPPKGLFGISPAFVDGIASICTEIRDKNDYQVGFKIEYINTDGETVYPSLSYKSEDPWIFPARKLNDGLRAYYDAKQQRWGYLDSDGNITIQPQYLSVHDFREGLAAVRVQETGKWGFIDTSGTMVLDPRFSKEPGDFYCGVAIVTRQDETSTLLYKDGHVFDMNFNRITPAIKDYCLAEPYRGASLLLVHTEKGVIGRLPGDLLDPDVETDYKVPFFTFYGEIYTSDMIPIWKIDGARYLSDGWFWKNYNMSYGAVIFNMIGECKIVFPIRKNDSF